MKDQPKIRWCRHHEKPSPMVDACGIGVDVAALKGKESGCFYRLPCHDWSHADIAKCACPAGGPEWFTAAEIAEQEAKTERWTNDAIRRIQIVEPMVRRIKKGDTAQGNDPCPVCKTGTVSWRCAASNRHVAMLCSTEDCISFME